MIKSAPYLMFSRTLVRAAPGAVGDALPSAVIFVREQVGVAMSAGDPQRGTGDKQPRTFDVAGVDRVTKSYVGEIGGADVSRGRESGEEGEAGIAGAGQRRSRNGDGERGIAMNAGIGREVTWTSMRPGRHVFVERSITVAPGARTDATGRPS